MLTLKTSDGKMIILRITEISGDRITRYVLERCDFKGMWSVAGGQELAGPDRTIQEMIGDGWVLTTPII